MPSARRRSRRRASPSRGGAIRLAEQTHLEAGRLARDARSVVLLPLGAVEQHGPHLPLAVDWMGAEALAERLGPHLRRAGGLPVLAPALPYGASPLAADWAGTVSLPGPLVARLIVAVVRALAVHGFRRFVLVNYQADPGHLRAMADATRVLRRARLAVAHAGFSPEPEAGAAMLDPRVQRLLRSPRPEAEWHSGELETALVQVLRPDLVRGVAQRLPPAWVDFRAGLASGARTFRQIDPRTAGYFGWPAAARPETARRALALRARLIAAHVVERLGLAAPGRSRRSAFAGVRRRATVVKMSRRGGMRASDPLRDRGR